MKYEVHWSEWLTDHLEGEWVDFTKKFDIKEEAINKAKDLTDKEDVDFIRVCKVINWKKNV